ncbi:hypothetical protein GALMADRAFT_239404 [Galerina marginata CBS 339.88]|uniref:Nucleolar protein 16 n=1 Tax=Galerina marginata (strain CBS 339.88) TaxID=685588 RepID=A0A067TEC0_GALM3|nr:hypothetical protein GALMADRAFT_239404 [Galerina marginata CBS 339.88]
MANPRQRRKARSSSHRPVSHSQHAKRNLKKTPPIRGPKALQDAWDKQKTVRQNYANLGLVVTLDPSAHGGVEKQLGRGSSVQPSQGQELSNSAPPHAGPLSGFGRIIRDGTGNVLGFELNEPTTQDLEKDLEVNDVDDLVSHMDQDVRRKWATNFSSGSSANFGPKDEQLVKDLEQVSASATGSTTLSIPISGIGSRHSSSGEMQYLQALVKKYGDNVDLMTRDLKLNPEQRTVGQLKRALRKAGL